MNVDDYISALQASTCRVVATTKKGEVREYVGSLPRDAQQRVVNSNVVPILLDDGTWKSFDVSRVEAFEVLP